MLQSNLFSTTRREAPKDEESKNAILLLRGGYVDKAMAGVYSFLPLGLRVIRHISRIVREEMDRLPGAQEVLMPSLQSRELWLETGRWEEAKVDVMYTLEEDTLALGPTHEEVVTDIFRRLIHSYKELPVALYQIQTKFRKEARAKSGLLRGREFLMKDLYSFHLSEEDLEAFYQQVQGAYARIYERCGVQALLTEAAGGMFAKYSHEFQVIAECGEDDIYLSADGRQARNKEIVPSEQDEELLAFSGGQLRRATSIEVGNIFKLNRRYSQPMGARVATESGEQQEVWMGCYGMGISRLMGTIVEVHGDLEKGKIDWPAEVAPFAIHLLDLTGEGKGRQLYDDLHSQGVDILYDDRSRTAGEKFADADLIGAPLRLIISNRSLEKGGVEVRQGEGEARILPIQEVTSLCR